MNARIPDRNLSDAADGELRRQAIENLSDRIKLGKHRNGIFELLDSELNSERYKIVLEEITMLLLNEQGARDDLAERMVAGLIERYLSTHDDLIEEEAAEIEREEM